MKKQNLPLVVMLMLTTGSFAMPVYADAISPQIKDKGKTYSKEKADTQYYGTGVGGRANEAMMLRFEVERMLQDGEWEEALPKAKKACQLDPGDPECHLLLARALTKKFYTKEGPIDEKLLRECLAEWLMLWHHDSDQFEQVEAKIEARRMLRIAKILDKKKKAEYEAKVAAKEAVVKQREKEQRQSEAQLAAERQAGANAHQRASAADDM
jgi:hypothetical protein